MWEVDEFYAEMQLARTGYPSYYSTDVDLDAPPQEPEPFDHTAFILSVVVSILAVAIPLTVAAFSA
jgi:hypothetical protein